MFVANKKRKLKFIYTMFLIGKFCFLIKNSRVIKTVYYYFKIYQDFTFFLIFIYFLVSLLLLLQKI